MAVREILNNAYQQLDNRALGILDLIQTQQLGKCTYGYYNGHYVKEGKEYQKVYYPLPVLSLEPICDIEIDLDSISVSAKLKNEDACHFEYGLLNDYAYEVYGVKEFLGEYGSNLTSIEELLESIRNSKEKEMGFSFNFAFSCENATLIELICILKENHFFDTPPLLK